MVLVSLLHTATPNVESHLVRMISNEILFICIQIKHCSRLTIVQRQYEGLYGASLPILICSTDRAGQG